MVNQSKSSPLHDEGSFSQLQKELQEAQLLVEAYRKMIDVAKPEFKIKIIKKSNTK